MLSVAYAILCLCREASLTGGLPSASGGEKQESASSKAGIRCPPAMCD